MTIERPKAKYLKDYQPSQYLIDTVNLEFELDTEVTIVTSTLSMRLNEQVKKLPQSLELNGEDLTLKSIKINDRTLKEDEDYALTEDKLTIFSTPRQFVLIIVNQINPSLNTAYEGLYLSDGLFCTQCEAEGFRKITYYLDRPDVMARFTTKITADKSKYPVLLSNGNPTESGDNDDGTHWVTWQDPFLKPSYLFALVAGDLVKVSDTYTTKTGKSVSLEIFVEAENKNKCSHAIQSLKNAMKWDEDVFGLSYDLDIYMIVAVNNFNMGAMENKGLNIFNSKYVLANPETATDDDFLAVEGVIGHEYFHNWTGNRVTLRDWFQLSLKEGLTVFRDQEFSSDMYSRAVKRIDDVNLLRNVQFVEDSGPTAHPIRPESYIEMNNFYTVTVYEKGAEVIRMLQTILGRENFLRGIELYIRRYDGKAVTTDDFVKAMEDVNELDLSQFRLWYSQAGTPELKVSWSYDEHKKEFLLTIKQTVPATPNQTDKKPMHIPVSLALLDKQGKHVPLKQNNQAEPADSMVLNIRKNEETYKFIDISDNVVPSILRNFSAPVTVHADYQPSDLHFLMQNETCPVNQWDAGQRIFLNELLLLIQQVEADQKLVVSNAQLFEAVDKILTSESLDPALIASMLQLPNNNVIMENLDVVNPDAIYQAKKMLSHSICVQLYDKFLAVYEKLSEDKLYSLEKTAIANRSLRGVCLNYLVQAQESSAIKIAYEQFKNSNNMTDIISALRALNNIDCQERHDALSQFHQNWQHDPLVINKWLSLQAVSDLPDTLDNVKRLLDHQSFKLSNPNNVYALLVCFSKQNIKHFHSKNGAAYAFIAQTVLQLDKMNPQVASRLVSAFLQWRRFDINRQKLMQKELENIMGQETLSKDVYEIVSRSLVA